MPNRGEAFRTDYPDSPVRPLGSMFNKFGHALNNLMPAIASSYSQGDGSVKPPPQIIGLAEITNIDDTCDLAEEGDPDSEVQAPCRSKGKYLGKFRYFDAEQKKWLTIDDEIRIDASSHNRQGSNTSTQAVRTKFAKGDVVPVVYDDTSLWFIPLCPPTNGFVRGKLTSPLSPGSSAFMDVWEFANGGEEKTDVNIEVYDWLMHASATALPVGLKVTAQWDVASSRYYVTGAECDPNVP